ncbi:Serologically defined colon cancer antigen 3 [Chamberlinius hualienensis]
MAEGGDSEENNNPYSFGSFIKNDKTNDNLSEDGNDEDAELDLGIRRRREAPNGENERFVNRREENPFSFRHFLKKDHSASNNKSGLSVQGPQNYLSSANENEDLVAGPSRLFHSNAAAPDFTSGLPDFVQGHFVLDGTHTESTNDADVLPDFTLDNNTTTSQHNLRDSKSSRGKRHHQTNAAESLFDVTCKAGTVRNGPQYEVSVTSSLPDFLSDGPMLSSVCDRQNADMPSSKKSSKTHNNVEDCGGRINGEMSGETLLRNENEMLQRELTETWDLLQRERQSVIDLKNEIEILKKKDNEEVAALEMMVQQVESNMQGTTERATVAEATIAKLKQEIKSLQTQLTHILKENEILKGSDSKRSVVAVKAKQAAEQMRSAADTAQHQLMQLLSGVESLKSLANMLSDIDRTNDIHTSNDNT